jgi:hypothetical protein
MRQGSLAVLLVLSLTLPLAHADENPAGATDAQQVAPEPLPATQMRGVADATQSPSSITDAERSQLSHLRQENHRLRMQLQDRAPAQQQPPLLNERQQWFAVGGGVGVLGFLLGVLTTRGRRRRQWLN